MVFPFQDRVGVGTDADSELAFTLQSLGEEVDWVLPAELREAVQSTPGMDLRVGGLPVSMFLRAEVRRVGDPLYGYLLRASALVNSQVALIPVVVRPSVPTEDAPARMEMVAVIIATRTGDVVWFGVEAGEEGGPNDPAAVASAAEALARRLLPFADVARSASQSVH